MKQLYNLYCSFLLLLVTTTSAVKAQVNINDSLALVDLYNSTEGYNWYCNNNWLTRAPVSTWCGVTVQASRVTKIILFDNYIIGSLPPSIGNLTALTEINLGNYLGDLNFYNFLDTIPASIGNCKQLEKISLPNTFLSHTIPSSFGQLTDLTFLDLSNNTLSGNIPSSIGNCENLQTLNLNTNYLSGSIPASIGNCKNLTYLYLAANKFTGNIPRQLGKCRLLEVFNASANKFTGNVPASLGNCTMFTTLVLTNNSLTGKIPLTLGKCENLVELWLGDNQLNGFIPRSLGRCIQLKHLTLDHNDLSGTIPSSIGNCTELEQIVFTANHLTGPIPESFGKLSKLKYLYLIQNELSGAVPASLGSLQNLQLLYLTENRFTFEGMELIAQKFPFAAYGVQALIPVHKNNNALSVSAGGTLSNNTYTWYNVSSGQTTVVYGDSVFHPATNGDYYVNVTNSIATKLTLESDTVSTLALKTMAYQSIKHDDTKERIYVYPNPASNLITIDFSNYEVYSLSITNENGKIITSKILSDKENKTITINIASYTSGIYFIQLHTQQGIVTKSLIKN